MSDGSVFGEMPATGVAGNARITTTTPDGGKQHFEVHPENMPRLLAGLDRVRDKYVHAQQVAERLGYVTPPIWDEMTKDITKQISQRAVGGPGNLYDTAQGMIDWVDGFKAAVQKAMDEYQRIDEDNSNVQRA